MSTITITSGYQGEGGKFFPTDNTDWVDLGSSPYATWSSWTSWNPSPNSIQLQVDDDLGSSDFRTPLLSLSYQGQLTVTLKISNTGSFSGEETTINFVAGTTYTYVSGRYYRFLITVATDSSTPVPNCGIPNTTYQKEQVTEFSRAVNTQTLGGTIDARPITSSVGMVEVLVATAEQSGVTYSSGLLQDRVYAIPDDYVFQENAIIVNIVTKNPPVIRCFDLNGESIDARVDVFIQGLPKLQITTRGIETA